MNYETRWLGLTNYNQALQIQKDLSEDMKDSLTGVLLGLEHPEVITLGIRGQASDVIKQTEAPVVRVNRGGQATYHNPGQLIIYPVCPIKKWQFGAREWVDLILDVTQKTLEKCNIIIVSSSNGLFTNNGKIASVGLNLKGGVSTHGVAINVCNNLDGFSTIQACGIQKQPMDRVNFTYDIDPESLFAIWCAEFHAVFTTKRDRLLTSEGLQI